MDNNSSQEKFEMFCGNGMKMFWKSFFLGKCSSGSHKKQVGYNSLHLNFVNKNEATFNFSVFHQKCHLSELVETDPFLPTFHIFYRQGRTLEHSNSLKPLKLLILGKMEEFLQMGETCKKDV